MIDITKLHRYKKMVDKIHNTFYRRYELRISHNNNKLRSYGPQLDGVLSSVATHLWYPTLGCTREELAELVITEYKMMSLLGVHQ